MEPEFFLNGQASGSGSVANRLARYNMDPGALRPYIGKDGRNYITVNQNGQPRVLQTNADATLRKDEWIELDRVVIEAAQTRLRAWRDLVSFGGGVTVANGMGTSILQYQAQSDISGATISMDGLKQSERDRLVYDLKGLPLPIIHKDFSFSLREVMMSRNGGSPLDTAMAALCGRKVAEEVENLVLGTSSTYSYGGYDIPGYRNFSGRITKTLSNPTGGAWVPSTLFQEVLQMKDLVRQDKHYGPFSLFFAPSWDVYLDDDYTAAYNGTSLRNRLRQIDGIVSVETVDLLPSYDVIMVQRTPDIARAVTALPMTTVQWETEGGLQLNFKVMTIMVPQLRGDYNGNTGIVHGTV